MPGVVVYNKREKITAPEDVSEAVELLLDGKMLEVKKKGLTKRISDCLRKHRERCNLRVAYDKKDKTTFMWLEDIPSRVEQALAGGFGGRLFDIVWGHD